MKSTILAAFAGLAIASVAGQFTNGTHFLDSDSGDAIPQRACGTDRSKASAHFNSTIQRFHNRHGPKTPTGARLATRQSTSITVPVYIHIITKSSSAGTITQSMADAQVQALNTAYNPHGITFTSQGTTFTANDAWAVAGTDADMFALKSSLRKGSYSALNLYFHTDLSGGILGTCTLPSQVTSNMPKSAYVSDGCNIAAATMPGGSLKGYNMGKTAVHETGHWLGLLHTFEGNSCSGNGDMISDTPVQMTSTNGCPTKPAKDSCPGVVGVDPIHNYMDYSTDACYTNFTPGQVARMNDMWGTYRKGM